MVRLILVFFLVTAVSCASNPKRIQYAGDSKEGDPNYSIITSVCDAACSKLVQSKIDYFIPWVVKTIQPVILSEIDGEKGPTTTKCADCVSTSRDIWNERGNYGFQIHVSPGNHIVKVSLNDHMSPKDEKLPIEISMRSGHSYFIGNIIKDLSSPLWSPVVVDTTSLEILYPMDQPW